MQHHRHLVAEHVAHQAAEDAGDHAGQYHDGRMRAHAHGDIAADHGECHQAQTVHQQEDHAQVMQVARDEAGDDRRADGEGEVLRVGDPADRVVAEQYVARRPATQCRHRAEQADAEQVHAAAHAHDGSGHGCQSNKSENAVKLFSEIQSLDRLKLAKSLSKIQTKLNKKIRYIVQVNTGNEKQKSGINPNELDEFIKTCNNNYGLKIKGLMCIPPINENPALHFAFMQKLYKKNKLESLSMGMSNDFETAIEFGATHIRVGSALFGTRLEKEEVQNTKDYDQT